jgi:membrane protease YdiL (CAAX protease family)
MILPFIIIATIALMYGVISPISNLIPISESMKNTFLDHKSEQGFFAFITLVIVAPVLEELIFRGIMLDGLLKNYSTFKSIVVSSFLFGLVHLNPWQFTGGFIFGLFSGWVYSETRSVSPSIIIHVIANFNGFLIKKFLDGKPTASDLFVVPFGRAMALTITILSSTLIVAMCIYFLKQEFKKGKQSPAADPYRVTDF